MVLKSANGKIIVGYDLGRKRSQISYYSAETKRIETASGVAGTQIFNIPTVLCKRYGTNQWLYGREAERAADQDEGILVDGLLKLALDGETVQIEEKPYDPVALLTLFVRKSLGLLAPAGPVERIGAFLVTCEQMDERLMQVLKTVLGGVGLKARHICFQDYEESFYQYMIHQPKELRAFQTVMIQWEDDRLTCCRMETNERTSPKAVFVSREEYKFHPSAEYTGEDGVHWQEMDREFAAAAERICGDRRISSVYLIGEAFDSRWMKTSLRYLCQGRRVFMGSNLYSQGACLGMMERLRPSTVGRDCVLLGKDKLRANVGVKLCRRGEESYYVLLNAGTNWYEASGECEFYLREGNSFELVITPLDGKKAKIALMTLEGLPAGEARIRLRLQMTAKETLLVEAEDLGFGEFRGASGQVWKEKLET